MKPAETGGDAPVLYLRRLRPGADADIPLPRYMTENAAGMDLAAAITEDLMIEPGCIRMIPTGFAMALPPGFEAQIRPRSGLAVKQGVTLINSPGTIDADYRGELMVALINLGPEAAIIRRGDRIAQMIITRVNRADIRLVTELNDTDRGAGGFGHTGRR